jgi:hypothetical protein
LVKNFPKKGLTKADQAQGGAAFGQRLAGFEKLKGPGKFFKLRGRAWGLFLELGKGLWDFVLARNNGFFAALVGASGFFAHKA